MPTYFDHEKLRVYQDAIAFVVWWTEIADRVPNKLSVKDQMERASTSISLNIAEGNGKFSYKDRCRYFDIARASTLECAAALDVLVARNCLREDEIEPAKQRLSGIVAMLMGLIQSNSSRIREELVEYSVGPLVDCEPYHPLED